MPDNMTREQLIERANLLKQANALRDEGPSNEPGLIDTSMRHMMNENVVQPGMKALDYARGNLTAPLLAKAMGVYSEKDAQNARNFTGHYPSTADMMEKAHVMDEHPIARQVLGIGGDIVTDPMTYASMGASALAKLKEAGMAAKAAGGILNPMEAFQRMRGNQLYKKAFEELDQKALERGKNLMPSSVLQDQRYAGNMGGAADTLAQVNEGAGKEIGNVLTDATSKGARVDMAHVFQPALDEATKLRKMLSPEAHDLASKIEGRVAYMQKQTSTPGFWEQYAGHGAPPIEGGLPERVALPSKETPLGLSDNVPAYREQVLQTPGGGAPAPGAPAPDTWNVGNKGSMPVDAANREKSFLNNLIKDSGFDQGAEAAIATKGRKAVSGSLSKGIPDAVTGVDPALGERLRRANELYSSTDPSIVDKAQAMAKRVKERTNPFMPSAVDMMIAGAGGGSSLAAGSGVSQGMVTAATALALKKLRDAAISTQGRTARGMIATKLGNSMGTIDPILRRSIWGGVNDLGGQSGEEK